MLLRKFNVVPVLLLSACAGGGGSSSTSTTAPTTPAPPPAPVTLAAAPIGTLFALAAHAGMEAFDLSDGVHSVISIVPPGYLAATASGQLTTTANGFTFAAPHSLQATFDLSAQSSQRIGTNLFQATGVSTPLGPGFINLLAGAQLTYSAFGTWYAGTYGTGVPGTFYAGGTASGALAYGIQTTQMPTTGSATFTGSALGIFMTRNGSGPIDGGNVRLVANFSAGSVSGMITNLTTHGALGSGRLSDIYLSAGSITNASFSGTATSFGNASSPSFDFSAETGAFGGQFNGPNAAEASGTFAVRGQYAFTAILGSFVATGQTTPAGQPVPYVATPPTGLGSGAVPFAFPLGTRAGFGTTYDPVGNHAGLEAFAIHDDIAGVGIPTGQFITSPTATVLYDGQGFELTTPGNTTGIFRIYSKIAGPNGSTVFGSLVPSTTGQSHLVNFMLGPTLTAAAYGSWDEIAAQNFGPDAGFPGTVPGASRIGTVAGGVVAYGMTSSQLPTSGSATYTGGVVGLYFLPNDSGAIVGGTSRLIADFDKATIAGTITGITAQSSLVANRTAALSDIFLTGGTLASANFNGSAVGGSNVISPVTDISTTTGTFGGSFYGANAAELAGTFNLSDASGRTLIAGAFGGKGQTTPAGQPTPTVPVPTSTSLTALAAVPVGTVFVPEFTTDTQQMLATGASAVAQTISVQMSQTTAGPSFQFTGPTHSITLGAANMGTPGHYSVWDQTPPIPPLIYAKLATTSLTYASYGVWALDGDGSANLPGVGYSTHQFGVFSYGVLTSANQMPTAGTATYTGSMAGVFATSTGTGAITSGAVALNADFAASTIGGSITGIIGIRAQTLPGGVEHFNDVTLGTASIVKAGASDVSFRGTPTAVATPGATIDVTGATGTYSGRFYGLNAAEVAGTIQFGAGSTVIQGAFAGKK